MQKRSTVKKQKNSPAQKNDIQSIYKDSMNKAKTELNKGNNLMDYFLVMGIEPSFCEHDDLYELTAKELNSKYNEELTPKIITKYPPFNKTYVNIDDGILNHCFHNKFEIKEYKSSPPQPEIFTFILDNYLFSIDHPQKYVTCFVFYENLSQYKELYDTIKRSNDIGEVVDTFNAKNTKEIIYKENDITIKKKRQNSFCYKNSNQYKNYYIPKALCLISVYPFFSIQAKVLNAIYEYSFKKDIAIPIEKIVQNLMIEVPLPPRGRYDVEFDILDDKMRIAQSEMNKLPNNEGQIKVIFDLFKEIEIVEIFKHLLYETKMIIFSTDIKLLTPFIFGLLSIMYPFKYSFQVVSCIPNDSYHIIESISPYIIGINQTYTEDFFKQAKVDIRDTSILIIDLNTKKIELKQSEKFPELPSLYKEKLLEKVEEALKVKPKNYKELFFQFNVNIMQNYSLYLNNDYYTSHGTFQNSSINNLFKVKEFIESFPRNDRPFYTKFITETQIFSDFIYKRMLPRDTNDKLEILFFDEHIMKQNRKIYSGTQKEIFLPSDAYQIKGTYTTCSPTVLSKEQSHIFISNKYRKSQLKKGQIVNIINNRVHFNYTLFPMLNSDIFTVCSKSFVFPPQLSNELDIINSDLISKSHLYSINFKNAEMENYLYLSWLWLWGTTYWYNDPIEKDFRFKQMLVVLDKVINHDMEVFNLLFESLNKFYEEDKIIKLYEKLISYRINPSQYIYSIVSKIMDKKKIKITDKKVMLDIEEKKANDQKTNNNEMILAYRRKNFRSRTLKNNIEFNIVTNEVKFFACITCPNCNNIVNLESLCKDFDKMKKDIFWIDCPICEQGLLPQLEIKIGLELNLNDSSSFDTSKFDSITLQSPFTLKNKIVEEIIQQSNKFLDVDNFRQKSPWLFWASLWYFYINGLDYSFILPYESAVYSSNLSLKIQIDPSQVCLFSNDIEHKSYYDNRRMSKRKKEKKISRFYTELIKENYVCEYEYLVEDDDFENLFDFEDKINKINVIEDNENMNYMTSASKCDIDSDYVNGTILRENTVYDSLSRNSDLDSDIDTIRFLKYGSSNLNEIKEESNDIHKNISPFSALDKAAQENGVYEEEKDLNCLNCNFKNSLPFNSKNKEQ